VALLLLLLLVPIKEVFVEVFDPDNAAAGLFSIPDTEGGIGAAKPLPPPRPPAAVESSSCSSSESSHDKMDPSAPISSSFPTKSLVSLKLQDEKGSTMASNVVIVIERFVGCFVIRSVGIA